MSYCPVCGKWYTEYPAISRMDNRTEICPQCGIIEALTAFGISCNQSKEILEEVNEQAERKTEI